MSLTRLLAMLVIFAVALSVMLLVSDRAGRMEPLELVVTAAWTALVAVASVKVVAFARDYIRHRRRHDQA